jgi:hypothetical protein
MAYKFKIWSSDNFLREKERKEKEMNGARKKRMRMGKGANSRIAG